MGLYKLCEHKGRARDRCDHAWWARFRDVRVSLEKWSNREIATKTEAEAIFDDLKKAVRAGTFEKCCAEPERKTTALTFRQFADIYKGAMFSRRSSRLARRSTTGSNRSSITSAIAPSLRSEQQISKTSLPI
jgi:hypothetical protein